MQEEAVLRIDYLALRWLPPMYFEVPARTLAIEGSSGCEGQGVQKPVKLAGRRQSAMARNVSCRATSPPRPCGTGHDQRQHDLVPAADEKRLDRSIAELSSGERHRLGLIKNDRR
jgi:hypothetical protein